MGFSIGKEVIGRGLNCGRFRGLIRGKGFGLRGGEIVFCLKEVLVGSNEG